MGRPAFLRGGELPSSTKRIAALLLRHVSRYPKFTGIYPLADRGLKVFPVDAGSNLGRTIIESCGDARPLKVIIQHHNSTIVQDGPAVADVPKNALVLVGSIYVSEIDLEVDTAKHLESIV